MDHCTVDIVVYACFGLWHLASHPTHTTQLRRENNTFSGSKLLQYMDKRLHSVAQVTMEIRASVIEKTTLLMVLGARATKDKMHVHRFLWN